MVEKPLLMRSKETTLCKHSIYVQKKYISLGCNEIGDEGAKAFAEALAENKSLKKLVLSKLQKLTKQKETKSPRSAGLL